MTPRSGSSWKPIAVMAVVALAALIVFGSGHAGAAGKGKKLRYAGSTSGATMTLEGPASGKGYPKNVTLKVSGTSQCSVEGGVKKPLKFSYELPSQKVSLRPTRHGHGNVPGIEFNEELGGNQGSNPEFPGPETDIFISGSFLKHGKGAVVNFTHEVPAKGSEVGSKEAEVSCSFKANFKLARAK